MTKPVHVGTNCASVGGSAMIAAAKMTGMTPAMFTRRGMYVAPPVVCRFPSCRRAYCTGMRRWPSCTNTTTTTTAIARIGKNSRSSVPPLTQAVTPAGAAARIDAKISSEMPLPMPRFVISSPIHISSAVPAVSVRTMITSLPEFTFGSAPWRLKRNA